jgi:non-ribosomal peptide synthetase component E (peptide arylation enzyme)
MIYIHSMGRAARYYPERPALRVGEELLNFRELHGRIKSLAAALSRRGFGPGTWMRSSFESTANPSICGVPWIKTAM